MKNEIIKHDLSGNYLFRQEKGKQKGIIYLNLENNFVGNILDSGNGYKDILFYIYGNLTPEKLRFMKIPKDPYFSDVFWSLNHENPNDRSLQYEGYFFMLSSSSGQKIETVNSLEKSIEFFKKNELDKVDSITKGLFEGMDDLEGNIKKNLIFFPKGGTGNIIFR